MLTTIGMNLSYAIVCIIIGIISMLTAYKLFDKVTHFNTADELKNANLAVAVFNGCIVLGSAILSALIIGLSVN